MIEREGASPKWEDDIPICVPKWVEKKMTHTPQLGHVPKWGHQFMKIDRPFLVKNAFLEKFANYRSKVKFFQ